MSTYLEYSDEEIRRLLRHAVGERDVSAATENKPPSRQKQPAPSSAVGINRELSIDEILKKVETEIAGDETP